jgi:hypothetical protein
VLETTVRIERSQAEADAEFERIVKRERALGRTAIRGELRNNDGLAHVYLAQGAERFSDVEKQIYTEFITDMGERTGGEGVEAKHFYMPFNYVVADNDLISDTGVRFRGMVETGLLAARHDAQNDPRVSYAVARAEVQSRHADMLIDWFHNDSSDFALIPSLCPSENEVPAHIAKLSNFKPERLMASMWLFERTETGIRMHAFSLDNLNLEGLNYIYSVLSINGEVKATTLEQMAQMTELPFENGREAVEMIRSLHDARLDCEYGGRHYFGIRDNDQSRDANKIAADKPEAYELYKTAVQEVAVSLDAGVVSPGLNSLAEQLRGGFKNGVPAELQLSQFFPITIGQARDFMDYLRRQALPEYIYGNANNHNENGSDDYIFGGIASAGAYAAENGIAHEGACPTSASAAADANSSEAAMSRALNIRQKRENWVWRMGKCQIVNCPSVEENRSAWVGPCDVCEACQRLYDWGRDPAKEYNKFKKAEPSDFMNPLSQNLKEIDEELELKRQIELDELAEAA